MFSKENLLFIFLGSFLVANAIIAEFVGVKLFSVEMTLGMEQAKMSIFGWENLSFTMTAGVLLWPVVFIMTDVMNEYYGRKGVRIISWLAAALITYAFLMVWLARETVPDPGWAMTELPDKTMYNKEFAFQTMFGAANRIIIGSLVAFLVGQALDAHLFQFMRRRLGSRNLWLRATGSTLVSQLFDSFIVLFIAFYDGGEWSAGRLAAIGIVNYIYKVAIAVLLIPVLYGIHGLIRLYLGAEKAENLTQSNSDKSP